MGEVKTKRMTAFIADNIRSIIKVANEENVMRSCFFSIVNPPIFGFKALNPKWYKKTAIQRTAGLVETKRFELSALRMRTVRSPN